MTIEVHAPGGVVIEFPDGTSGDTISAAMTKNFGKAPKSPSPNMASGLTRAVATGVPLVGGLLNSADAATDAALAPLLNPLFSKDKQLQGKTWGERYGEALKTQQGMDQSFGEAHPVAQTAGEIGGAAASTGGASMYPAGAKLLGLAGKTLPEMMRAGAISGGAIGATDSAVRGQDPLKGAEIGAGAGFAGPVVGRAAGLAGSALGEQAKQVMRLFGAAKDPAAEASAQVSEALGRDFATNKGPSIPSGDLATAQQAGQPVSLMDLGGQATRRLARRSANFSSEGQEILQKTIGPRFRTQGDRLADWLDTKFHYPNADATQKALDDVARTVNKPAYARAYAAGAGGLWNEDFAQISQAPVVQDAIRKAMVGAKNEAARQGFTPPKNPFAFDENGRLTLKKDENGNRMLPNLQFWDIVKRGLDKTGTREAKDWSRVLREHLDEHVPSYADARAGAAKFFGAGDALEAGQQAVTARMNNRQIAEGLSKMSPAERRLFQDGFVDRYVQMIRETPDRRNVLDRVAASRAEKERLYFALGPDRANELEAYLRVEDVMDRARIGMGNSTTAQQTNDMKIGALDLLDTKSLLTKVFHGMAKEAGRGIDEKVAQKIAEMLTSNDVGKINSAIKSIAKNPTLMSALRDPKVLGAGARGAAGPAGKRVWVD